MPEAQLNRHITRHLPFSKRGTGRRTKGSSESACIGEHGGVRSRVGAREDVGSETDGLGPGRS
jgi:hypothetical protein